MEYVISFYKFDYPIFFCFLFNFLSVTEEAVLIPTFKWLIMLQSQEKSKTRSLDQLETADLNTADSPVMHKPQEESEARSLDYAEATDPNTADSIVIQHLEEAGAQEANNVVASATKEVDTSDLYVRYATLIGHKAPVTRIQFSPNGRYLATASMDSTIKIWICPNKLVLTIRAHTAAINDITWNRTGQFLVSVSNDRSAKVWRMSVGYLFRTLPVKCGSILCSDFHPNSRYVALGSAKRKMIIWNILKKKKIKIIYAHNGSITSLNYNKSGEILVSCGSDGTCSIWNSHSGQRISSFVSGNTSITAFARFSPSGKMLLQSHLDHSLNLVDPFFGNHIKTYKGHTNCFSTITSDIYTTPYQSSAISGSEDGYVYVWDLDSCEITQKLKGHKDIVKCVTFYPTKKIIASGSNDSTVIIWAAESVLIRATNGLP